MQPLRRFDYKLTRYILAIPKSWRPLMAGVSFLGQPQVVLAIGFAGFLSALGRGQTQIVRAFFFATIAYGLNTLLKLLLHRRRPHNLNITTLGFRSYSFPSGHAFGTVIFYGLFAYLDYNFLASPWNWLITAFLVSLLFLIGISRVFLKAHYPSDVLGGWVLGILSLALVVAAAF